jgi:hypothetical protein
MKKGYTAFNLTEQSRQNLLSCIGAKHSTVVAHHITHKFNVLENETIPEVKLVKAVAYAEDEHCLAAVVEVNGSSERPDGGVYHITISHDETVKPYYSNSLIAKGVVKINPFELSVKPTFNAF